MKAPFFPHPSAFPRLGGVACLAAVCLCLTPLKAAELVAEYDFEAVPPYLPGWGAGFGRDYKPAAAWKAPFTVALDTANPHSGAKAVKVAYLEAAKGDKIFHSQGLSLPENTSGNSRRIRIRFFYRLTGISDGMLQFSVMEINSQTKSKRLLDRKKVLRSLAPAEEWRSVEYEGNLNADTNQVQLIWANTSGEAPGALWIDDVSIDLVTPAA